jgi:transposase
MGITLEELKAFGIIVVEYSDAEECPECGEMSTDFRGDWCKDCDKQEGAK